MARYLVTGGAGFIGSHIVDELVARGQEVRVLDNLSTGRLENLAHLMGRIDWVQGDIRDTSTVRQVMADVDYVLHLAALPSVPRSIADPVTTNDVNVNGTLNLLLAARDVSVKRFVYASSSSVYGNSRALPKREDMPTQPLSPYAVSKLGAESYCLSFWQVYQLPVVALRYFNVFGPRQDPTSQYSAVVPKFITALLAGDSPVIYGDGSQSRDFTFVANVVEANLLACASDRAVGKAINVACGEQHSLLDLYQGLSLLLKVSAAPVFAAPRAGDVKDSLASIQEARRLLDYEPPVGWHEGLQRTVAWYAGRGAWADVGQFTGAQAA